jgi:NADH:ubiquinone oxidoreductase subunit 5 (subunit L)/multisubunit Na+/H+ antiporter MnhA subunit
MADSINNGVALGDTGYIMRIGMYMLLVALLLGVCSIFSVYWGSKVAMAFGCDVRGSLFRQVESFSQNEINQFGAPSLITRNTNDVQQVQMMVAIALTVMLGAPLMVIGGIIMALRQDAPLTITLAVILPVMALVMSLIVVRAIPQFRAYQVKLDRINEVVFAGGARRLGAGLWKGGDVTLIDGIAVNGTARLIGWVAAASRLLQSGHIYTYAFGMIVGLAVLITLFVTLGVAR